MPATSLKCAFGGLLLLEALHRAEAHTWIDKITCKKTGHSTTIRDYVPRVAGNNVDENTIRMLDRNPDQDLCGGKAETANALPCPAGSEVEIEYYPNGHVTIDNCPSVDDDPRCRTISWGTKTVQNRESRWTMAMFKSSKVVKRKDVRKDKSSKVVKRKSVRKNAEHSPFPDFSSFEGLVEPGFNKDFFDGQCGEEFSGQPCKQTFTIPSDAEGHQQFIFYWIFDRDFNGNGEEYSSCFDLDVSPSSQSAGGNTSEEEGPAAGLSTSDKPSPAGSPTLLQTFSAPPPAPIPPPDDTTDIQCHGPGQGNIDIGIDIVEDVKCMTGTEKLNGCIEQTGCRYCLVEGKFKGDPKDKGFFWCEGKEKP